MLLHHRRLPEAVLVVLAEQAAKRAARDVEDPDRGVEDDPAAGEPEAQVELVVLVSQSVSSKRPARSNRLGPKRAVGHGVDLDAVVGVVPASSRCRRTGCPSRTRPRARIGVRPVGDEDSADVPRARLLGRDDAAAEIVARVAARGSRAERSGRRVAAAMQALSPCETQRAGFSRIVSGRPCCSARGAKSLDRPVARAAVGDEHLQLAVEVLRRQVGDESSTWSASFSIGDTTEMRRIRRVSPACDVTPPRATRRSTRTARSTPPRCRTGRTRARTSAAPRSCGCCPTLPAACSSISAVTTSGWKKPCRATRSGDRTSASSAAARCAATSRSAARSRASCPRGSRCGSSGATAFRSSRFFERPRTFMRLGSASANSATTGVEERHARLERVRHARAVGLDEHVVDEEHAQVERPSAC